MSFFLQRNESNGDRLWGVPNATPFVKDSINDYVVHDNKNAVNPASVGDKSRRSI
jgi:hypothetical protein